MANIQQDQLILMVNELMAWKNGIQNNSKPINLLDPATAGNKLVPVYNETSLVTEKFDLTAALALFNYSNDKITQLGNITRSVNTFTFEVGFQGIIGGLNYANTIDFDIEVDEATTSNFRTDIVVLDTNNNIYLIQGVESTVIGIQPPTPPNTLFICEFNIFGSTIGNPNTVNNNARPIKLINSTGDYTLLQSDENKYLVLESESRPLVPVAIADNTYFVIKNLSGSSQAITNESGVSIIGATNIPNNGLCFLKKIKTELDNTITWSSDVISAVSSSTPTQQTVTESGNTITNLDLFIVQETDGNLVVVNADGDEVRITSTSINVFKNSIQKNFGINEEGFYYIDGTNSKIIKQTFEPISADHEIVHRAKSGTVAHLDDFNNYAKIISKSTVSTSAHTGVTTEAILRTITINPNDFSVGDFLKVVGSFTKLGTAGTCRVRFRAGTSNSISDAEIATYTAVANSIDFGLFRDKMYFFDDTGTTKLRGMLATNNSISDISSIAFSKTNTTINPTSTWYFHITAQLTSGADSITLDAHEIIRA